MSAQPLTRIAGSVYSEEVAVDMGGYLAPGMTIELETYGGIRRVGVAKVRAVEGRHVTFERPLNLLICGAAPGDQVFEHIPPCVHCRCVVCTNRAMALDKILKDVCVEHDDCRAALLAHACKHATPDESGDEKEKHGG